MDRDRGGHLSKRAMSDSIRRVLRIRALFATVLVAAIVVLMTIPPVRNTFIAIPAVEEGSMKN